MIKEYTISNFKAFSTPATLPIKPITLIYGENSAGKSSLFQSLMLLKQSLDFQKWDEQRREGSLSVKGEYVDIKSFDRFVHNQNRSLTIEYKILIDINEFENHPLKFKTPKKTQKLINMIKEDYDSIGMGYSILTSIDLECIDNLEYDDENFSIKTDVYANELNLYIGEGKSFIKYLIGGKAIVNKQHSFWNRYWENIGKDLAQKELNVRCGYMKKSGKNMQGEDMDEEDEFKDLIALNESIRNEKGYNEKDLIDFFEKYCLNPDFFNEYALLFTSDGIDIADYSQPKPWSGDTYFRIEDIFSGISCNNQIEYFTDNITIIGMMISELVQNILERTIYIGPYRNIPDNFQISIKKKEINMYVGKDGSCIGQILQDDKFFRMKINDYLSRLTVQYHLEIDKVNYDEETLKQTYALTICRNYTHFSSYLSEVGFGISQIIPIVVQCILSENQTILIEQPELHLHPALQAELGDLFIDSAIQKNNTLLIETHSEHILLRIMRRIRETTNGTLPDGITPIRAEDVSVVYVESVETDGDRHSIIREMPLNEQGELIKAWPGGFFEEGLNEVF